LGPQKSWLFGVLEQVVFRQEGAEILRGEVVIWAIEAQQVELLTSPVIDVDRTGSRVLGCYWKKQYAIRHLNPAGGYGFPDLEKRLDYAVDVGLRIAKSQFSYTEQAVGIDVSSAELHVLLLLMNGRLLNRGRQFRGNIESGFRFRKWETW
jgi:hypothetical protein